MVSTLQGEGRGLVQLLQTGHRVYLDCLGREQGRHCAREGEGKSVGACFHCVRSLRCPGALEPGGGHRSLMLPSQPPMGCVGGVVDGVWMVYGV